MNVQRQDDAGMDTVARLIKEIRFAMLTTAGPDGMLHSRPMSTLEMDSDGNLWFFTALHSCKVDDLNAHQDVNLAYVRTDKQDYLSIAGSAKIIRDREKMASLWTPWLKPWFQDGLDDPDLILLKVHIEEAHYWDAPGSAMKRLYGLVKGALTGNTDALGEQGRVTRPH